MDTHTFTFAPDFAEPTTYVIERDGDRIVLYQMDMQGETFEIDSSPSRSVSLVEVAGGLEWALSRGHYPSAYDLHYFVAMADSQD